MCIHASVIHSDLFRAAFIWRSLSYVIVIPYTHVYGLLTKEEKYHYLCVTASETQTQVKWLTKQKSLAKLEISQLSSLFEHTAF